MKSRGAATWTQVDNHLMIPIRPCTHVLIIIIAIRGCPSLLVAMTCVFSGVPLQFVRRETCRANRW